MSSNSVCGHSLLEFLVVSSLFVHVYCMDSSTIMFVLCWCICVCPSGEDYGWDSLSDSQQYWLQTHQPEPWLIYFIHTKEGLFWDREICMPGWIWWCVINAVIPGICVCTCVLSVSDCVLSTTITIRGERDCAINKSVRWQQKLIKGDHWRAEGRLEAQGGGEIKKTVME